MTYDETTIVENMINAGFANVEVVIRLWSYADVYPISRICHVSIRLSQILILDFFMILHYCNQPPAAEAASLVKKNFAV
jgi:hypothetical protein